MSYASEVLADSPLAYWRLNETSGAVAADSSGNGRNSAYTTSAIRGVTGLLIGDSDLALGFATGSAECATCASAAWMNVTNLTVECLFKPTASVDNGSGDAIVSRLNANLDWLFWRVFGSNVVEVSVWNTAGTRFDVVGPALTNGVTYHLAFTVSNTAVTLYVNGASAGSVAFSGTLRTASDPIEVGRYSASGATTPNGTIDEVAIYGTALSGARIAAHQGAAAPTLLSGVWGMVA